MPTLIRLCDTTPDQIATCAKVAGLDERNATARAMYAEPFTGADHEVLVEALNGMGYTHADITDPDLIWPVRGAMG